MTRKKVGQDGELGGEDVDLDPLGGRMWTPEEVADYLRVDKETLRSWRRKRTGPPVVLCAPATARYPENGLIIWKRNNVQVHEPRRLAS
jgi:hypothetical protein